MSRWNAKTSTLIILSCLTFLMLLIVVLPDVDLPDTAFHNGTAPIVVHTRATAAPAIVAVAALFGLLLAEPVSHLFYYSRPLMAGRDPNFRPILLRSIRR
jgi:predicted membrane protein